MHAEVYTQRDELLSCVAPPLTAAPEPYAGYLPDPPPPPEVISAALAATFADAGRARPQTEAAGTSAQLF